jgi:hypothetical protein
MPAGLDGGEIVQVALHDLAQFRVLLGGRAAADGDHALHVRSEQALAQHALSDHAGGAEENDVHDREE